MTMSFAPLLDWVVVGISPFFLGVVVYLAPSVEGILSISLALVP
jgi:hypothetical protein